MSEDREILREVARLGVQVQALERSVERIAHVVTEGNGDSVVTQLRLQRELLERVDARLSAHSVKLDRHEDRLAILETRKTPKSTPPPSVLGKLTPREKVIALLALGASGAGTAPWWLDALRGALP